MSFWSGETLATRLHQLIEPFDESRIDCAAYTLRVGPEVYVSPSSGDEASSKTKVQLTEGQSFPIPAGQFAFLLTEELIRVPESAVAFISIKSRIKFKGLVNVSGFHVDPGYKGRLIFAVFNAGPAPVHLARGDDCFLIWYADLDKPSELVKKEPGFNTIPSELINPIAGEIQSFAGLLERIRSTENQLTIRMNKIDSEQSTIKVVITPIFGAMFAAALTLAILLGTRACEPAPTVLQVAPVAAPPAQPAAPAAAPSPQGATPPGRDVQQQGANPQNPPAPEASPATGRSQDTGSQPASRPQ